MPDYSYKAVSGNGTLTKGVRFADSEHELSAKLKEDGLLLLESQHTSNLLHLLTEVKFGGVSRRDLIDFCYNLGVMIRAGVPIIRALDESREDMERSPLHNVIGEIIENIKGGDALHEAMAKKPKVFSIFMTNVVAIGESSGRLDTVFFALAANLKKIDSILATTRKALIYPAFVIMALMLAAFVFLVLVFPPLLDMLAEFNVELPLITRVVMFLSNTLRYNWLTLLLILAGCAALFILARKNRNSRYYMDWLELHTPGCRKLFIQIRLTFFMRYMAMMLGSGIDILRSLELGTKAVNNLVLKEILVNCHQKISEGSHFSSALKESKVVPRMITRMIGVGEESGVLDEQMERIADHYDEELSRRINLSLALLEPVLIVILALMAMGLVMGVLLPLYSLVTQMSGQVGSGM